MSATRISSYRPTDTSVGTLMAWSIFHLSHAFRFPVGTNSLGPCIALYTLLFRFFRESCGLTGEVWMGFGLARRGADARPGVVRDDSGLERAMGSRAGRARCEAASGSRVAGA